MKTFNMTVTDKRLVREETEEVIICGNGDYEIKFTFDTEWASHAKKTARFTYNGEHHDVEFSGNTCPIPMIVNASVVEVGVYAGEEAAGEKPRATTKVSILCIEGGRCGDSVPHPESGENYTNEARGYAEQAQEAAETAQEAAANIKGGLEELGSVTIPRYQFTYIAQFGCANGPMSVPTEEDKAIKDMIDNANFVKLVWGGNGEYKCMLPLARGQSEMGDAIVWDNMQPTAYYPSYVPDSTLTFTLYR